MSIIQRLTSSQLGFQLVLALVLMLVAAGGCGKGADTPEPADEADERHDAIAWFAGSPDAAFALAKSERKPVFLYWGADWCPPCQYLKNKVFKRPAFVEKSKDFVTVYLDADMKSAQYLGDKFGIMGYPVP